MPLGGGGLQGPGDEDLRQVINKMDAFAFTAASAAAAVSNNDKNNKNEPTNITPI